MGMKFEEGDRVKVVRKGGGSWVKEMNKFVGKEGVVRKVDKTGSHVMIDKCNTWWFPSKCLELLEELSEDASPENGMYPVGFCKDASDAPTKLSFSRMEMIDQCDLWMAQEFGAPKDLAPDKASTWFERNGLITAFIRHLFKDTE